MALAKPVRSLVNRATARGAVYDDGMLKWADGKVIVGVPQDHDVRPDKIRQFQLAVGLSGILDLPLMNGHHDEPEEPEAENPPAPEEPPPTAPEPHPEPPPSPVEELTLAQAARLIGITASGVGQAVSQGRIPAVKRKVAGVRGAGMWFVRTDDVEKFIADRGGPGQLAGRPRTRTRTAAPDAGALVAAVRPESPPAAPARPEVRTAPRTRYDMTTPSGRVSAAVAQVKAAHAKLDAVLADLMQGLTAIEKESTGMLQELVEGRAKVRKVEQMIGRVVDVL